MDNIRVKEDSLNNWRAGFEIEEGKKKGLDGKACWDGYKLAGTKKKGGKTVDNCVKEDQVDEGAVSYNTSDWRNDLSSGLRGIKRSCLVFGNHPTSGTPVIRIFPSSRKIFRRGNERISPHRSIACLATMNARRWLLVNRF